MQAEILSIFFEMLYFSVTFNSCWQKSQFFYGIFNRTEHIAFVALLFYLTITDAWEGFALFTF